MSDNHFWDASTYDRVSNNVQLEWGRRLLEKRRWSGNETVMDAGAGSGNLTKILADKVPHGMVYAVDADQNMVRLAKDNLSVHKNAQVIHSSMDDVNLPAQVDVIFSNAALHWILDQEKLFSHFWHLLKPNGELLIEYGGHGNVDRVVAIILKMMQSAQFIEHFTNWKQSWHFPKQDETERLLHNAGFREIQVTLSEQTTDFPSQESFAAFVKTVIMKPFFGYLPDTEKRNEFLEMFLDEAERSSPGWSLDYVRIGIFARK